jgi:hypothetical protein
VISRHRDVGFVSNLDDKLSLLNLKGRWNNRLHRLSPPRDPKLRPFRDRRTLVELGRFRIAPAEAWSILDRQIAPLMSTPFRDLGAEDCTPWLKGRLQNFFESRMAAQHSDVFVQHLTGWPRAGFIRAAFPETRFVHVIRDGRAVANSWLQMGWWRGYQGPEAWHLGPLSPEAAAAWEESGRSFAVLAGLGWKLLIEAFEQARAEVPSDQWMEVRYEDVVAEPSRHLREIADFIGLVTTSSATSTPIRSSPAACRAFVEISMPPVSLCSSAPSARPSRRMGTSCIQPTDAHHRSRSRHACRLGRRG